MSPSTCLKVAMVIGAMAALTAVITVSMCVYNLAQEAEYSANTWPRAAQLVQLPDMTINTSSSSNSSSSTDSTPPDQSTSDSITVGQAAVLGLMLVPQQLPLDDNTTVANDTRPIIFNDTETLTLAATQQSTVDITVTLSLENDTASASFTDFYASVTMPLSTVNNDTADVNSTDLYVSFTSPQSTANDTFSEPATHVAYVVTSISQAEMTTNNLDLTSLSSGRQESTPYDTSVPATVDLSDVTLLPTSSIPAAATSIEPQTKPVFTSIASITDVAFYAKKSQKHLPSSVIVFFDELTVNDGYFHNRITFTAPKPGYYWFFFAITVDDTKAHHYQLTVRDQDFVLGQIRYRQVRASKFDTIVDSKAAYLNAGDKVEMKSTDPNPSVSWGGYMFDNATSALCFQAKSSEPDFGSLSNVYALEEGWDETKQVFKVPHDGIYYFSFTVAIPRTQPIWPGVLVWHYKSDTSSEKCRASFSSKYHDRSDTLSSGCLLQLVKNDEVKLLIRGDHGHVNFLGFSHTPSAGEHVVAWSVSSGPCVVEKDHLIHFKFVEMNVGGCLSASSTTQAVIPVSGTYFLELVGTSQSGNPVSVQLVRNSDTDSAIVTLRFMRRSNSETTRSVSAIETLNANDILTIQYADGHQQGDSFNVKELTFMGLLLYSS